MWAPELTAILWKLDTGYIDDWSELCEFALVTDSELASLYETRISRVTQATWVVKPNPEATDKRAAAAAAMLCQRALARLPDFGATQRHLLHGIFVGAAFAEMEWEIENATDGFAFVKRIHHVHTRRFRYDTKWIPRLYDWGQRRVADSVYGETLDPRRWIVHTRQAIAGYPNVAALLRPAIWNWLFARWVDKFYIQAVETFNRPFVWAEVARNTPEPVRSEFRQGIENLVADHAAVIETGGALKFQETALSTSGQSLHSVYLDRYVRRQTKLILGTSDATDPGANGTQGAVTTRTGATMDPRMIDDGIGLGETIAQSMFKWLLTFNAHLFGGNVPPIPIYVAKTASDEVKTDLQDLQEQGGGGSLGSISSGGALESSLQTDPASQQQASGQAAQSPEPDPKIADTALKIVSAIASGEIPRDAGVAIIKRTFGMGDAEAEEMVGSAGRAPIAPTPEPMVPQAATETIPTPTMASDPKAPGRPSQGRQTAATERSSSPILTSPTSQHSATKLAEVLRGASVDRRR